MTTIVAAGTADVLAILTGRDTGAPVDETAAALARLADGEVRQLRLAAGLSPQRAIRQVMLALRRPGTVSGVLASEAVSRPLWQAVARQAVKPVVLVPAGAWDQPARIRRVLLPLDGTARSAVAVAAAAARFARSGAELVVLHVFGPGTVPRFWDQHAHAGQAWTQEFLARYCALPRTRLELRHGAAAEHVVDVAGTEHADMIVLAWSQRLEPGHAPVVRRAVLDAQVPVMLLPMGQD